MEFNCDFLKSLNMLHLARPPEETVNTVTSVISFSIDFLSQSCYFSSLLAERPARLSKHLSGVYGIPLQRVRREWVAKGPLIAE